MTLISTTIIIILALNYEEAIIHYYFNGEDYSTEFRVGLVWMFFSSLYTYLGVIPRYDKKPKIYVVYSTIHIITRIVSTIIFVVVLNYGIMGVIYGHLVGSVLAFILYFHLSYKYITLRFNGDDAKAIVSYSFPMLPGLFVIGLFHPLSRDIISKHYSMETLGLFSFAMKLGSFMAIVRTAIRFAWQPMVFEDFKSQNFNKDLIQISRNAAIFILTISIILTLLSPEIILFLGTEKFYESRLLFGFLTFSSIFTILAELRGIGPAILKKTYVGSIISSIGVLTALILLSFIAPIIGIIGIGMAFLIGNFLKYLLIIIYTGKKFSISFYSNIESTIYLVMCLSISVVIYDVTLFIRILITAIFIIFIIVIYSQSYKQIRVNFKNV